MLAWINASLYQNWANCSFGIKDASVQSAVKAMQKETLISLFQSNSSSNSLLKDTPKTEQNVKTFLNNLILSTMHISLLYN